MQHTNLTIYPCIRPCHFCQYAHSAITLLTFSEEFWRIRYFLLCTGKVSVKKICHNSNLLYLLFCCRNVCNMRACDLLKIRITAYLTFFRIISLHKIKCIIISNSVQYTWTNIPALSQWENWNLIASEAAETYVTGPPGALLFDRDQRSHWKNHFNCSFVRLAAWAFIAQISCHRC